jgi:hypothetical protein
MAHGDTSQILSAWQAMTARDLMILRKMGEALIDGTSYAEPLDLMHEAFDRCLDGRRSWPTHVRFSVFLGNAMRSIASAERANMVDRRSARADFADWSSSCDERGSAPSAEHEAMARQELAITMKAAAALSARLWDDEAARKVLNGILAGMSPKEMRESFGMDAKVYDAARMRVARRMRQARAH